MYRKFAQYSLKNCALFIFYIENADILMYKNTKFYIFFSLQSTIVNSKTN